MDVGQRGKILAASMDRTSLTRAKCVQGVLSYVQYWKPLRKPKFIKVGEVAPDARGVNLMLSLVISEQLLTEADTRADLY